MLEFLCGAAGSGKTEEIYRRAQQDASSGKSVFLLVPDQYSMFAEQELISRLGLSVQNKIQVLTFARLSNMVFSKLGPLRTRYIDKAGKYLVACRAMQLLEKELKFFAQNINQPGFASLIVSLFSEFKRYGVTPEVLEENAKSTDDAPLGMKLSDLAAIYRKFNELIEKEYSNAEDSLAVSVSKIPQCDFLCGTVYVNFFKSFTPVEYAALSEIMKKANLCVALCCDCLSTDSAVFSSQAHTYTKLCGIAKDLNIPVRTPEFLKGEFRFSKNAEFRHLRDNFFSFRTPQFDKKPDSIHIYTPENRYAEVVQCARLIRRLCRTKGYSFNDFLVLTGSMESYDLLIPSIFEEFEINHFLDRKVRLTDNPLMRMIIAILEILAYGFSYERVMTIIRSGYWDISKPEADIFENYILAADITHKEWNSSEPWQYNPKESAFDMEQINAAKSKVINPLLELCKMFSGRKTIAEICGKICVFLNTINLQKRVSTTIDQYISNDRIEAAEQLHRTWNSFVSVINQIAECMTDTYATFTEFLSLFNAACGELTVGIVPPTQDKVMISEISRFRSTGEKVVIVLGVYDSSFPKSHSAEGLISDAERNKLADNGLILAPDAFSRQKEEQFLVYSVLTTASEHLYLFSPASDKEGNSLGSSSVIKRVKALFPEITSNNTKGEDDLIESRENAFYELSARLFEVDFEIEKLKPIWKNAYAFFADSPEYRPRLEKFRKMHSRRGLPTKISAKTAEQLYGKPLILSVSKLEKYNSCAFSFFMRYGLFANERLLGGLKDTDTGSILHSVLCDYFKANKDADFSQISRNDCFSDIAQLVDKVAEDSGNSMFAASNFYSYMMLRIKNIATSTAWKLVKFYSQSEFRPTDFEISFGRHGQLPAYEISTNHGKAFLEGFIDRVDRAELGGKNYISITDYKSSEKGIDEARINAGITIQPLIYANAVTRSASSQAAAMMYMQMTDPIIQSDSVPTEQEWESSMSAQIKINGIFLDEPEVILAFDKNPDDKKAEHYVTLDKKSLFLQSDMEKKLQSAEECAARTADSILDGNIDAEPPSIKGFDPCAYCPYSGVCREE